MEAILPHIGLLPHRLWPVPASDGHGEMLFVHEPRLRVILEVFSKASRSPLHAHTYTDRFFFVAEGDLTIVTAKQCVKIKAGDGIIVRADTPHGFLIPDSGLKMVSLALGIGVEESGNELPHHLCELLAPVSEDVEQMRALEHETRWKDLYSQFEVQTIAWAKRTAIEAMEEGRPLPFSLKTPKSTDAMPLQGWKTPQAFILKVKGYAIGFSYFNDPGREYLKVNRINAFRFGLTRSDQPIPVLK